MCSFLVYDFGSFWKFRGDPGGCDSALPLSIKHKFSQVLRSGVVFFILGISRHFWTFVRLGPVQTQVFTGFLVGRREKGTATPHRLVMHRRASGKVGNAPSKHFGENRKISARGRQGPAVGSLFALCSSRFALDSFGVRQTQKGTAPAGGPKGLTYGRKCANAGFQIDDRATAAGSMPSSRSIRKASPTVQPHRSAMSWTLASSPLPLASDSASRTPQ